MEYFQAGSNEKALEMTAFVQPGHLSEFIGQQMSFS